MELAETPSDGVISRARLFIGQGNALGLLLEGGVARAWTCWCADAFLPTSEKRYQHREWKGESSNGPSNRTGFKIVDVFPRVFWESQKDTENDSLDFGLLETSRLHQITPQASNVWHHCSVVQLQYKEFVTTRRRCENVTLAFKTDNSQVARAQSWEREQLVKAVRYATLPSGHEIAYDSQANLDILRREILDDRIYQDRGIRLEDGNCIVDVGANIGMFVLLLNQILREGRVLALEPIPATYALLEINCQRHNRLQLKLFNCGLSREPGEIEFDHFPLTSVASSMFPCDSPEFRRNSRRFILTEIRGRGALLSWLVDVLPEWSWFPLTETIRRIYQRREKIRCRLETLSVIIEQEKLDRIDLLKIDTEGAEHEILAGIKSEHWSLIKQVIVEVHDGMDGVRSVLEILTTHGFLTSYEKLLPTVDHLYVVYAARRTDADSGNTTSMN